MKVDFLQKERDEIPERRPVIIYIAVPTHSQDHSMHTSQLRLFQIQPNLPEGVFQREGNPYQFCLIKANPEQEKFDKQLKEALEAYKQAAYKVLVLNAHATKEGVILHEDEDAKMFLTGQHFAEVLSAHTHEKHLHVLVFTPYGHIFTSDFYTFVQRSTKKEVQSIIAITSFTTQSSPQAWDRVATWGNPHIEVKRDVGHFIRQTIEPNSPYKVLDAQLKASQCVLL